ncbi:BZ3500_MvSof-1268-A1-R1_Chr2-3g05265 [Microbotryum saponariae]|uniref:BZ3500_MvSof-1268-A1-R1_Chr2-3g05265 protein n=1 Tax=Microbotryum saponariae TaxID=289078 RepID=A0A2X0L3D0_9BASI|nr:BZ3500_MvSof-1268-A1-R1_Chr2-3g05265 [Microbotryum saponariae]SDA01091.1 BZ3501_MvSof-1269-A2-R1_Chr2-2g04938 [Microbotryum saponariae]
MVNRSGTAPRSNAAAAPPRGYSSSSSSTPSRPVATQRAYDGQIRFAIKRMHAELERRERERVAKPRRPQPTAPGTKSRKSGLTVTGFLLRVAVFYVLIAYYLVCPNDKARERAVCRQLDVFSAKLQSLEPHARPYLDYAHRHAEPYLAEFHKYTEPYVAKVQPIYAKVDSYIDPVTNKLSEVYDSYVYPGLVKGIHATQAAARPVAARAHEQYQRSLAPSVEWYSRAGLDWYKSNAEHHVATADRVLRTSSKRAMDFVAPAVPFAHHHFWNTVVPTAQSTYKTSHETYFAHVHPQVVVARGHAFQFWRKRIVPALHHFYELYIAPQVDKISERVHLYKFKKMTAEEEARAKAEVEAEDDDGEGEDEDSFADFVAEPLDQVPIIVEIVEDVPAEDVVETGTVDEVQDTAAAERAEVEALQDRYDQEVAELGQAHFEKVATQLAALRSQTASDVTKKVEPALLKLRRDSAKLADQLTDFLTRDDGRTKEQKLDKGQQFRTVVLGKSKQAADGVRTEAEKLARTLKTNENKIVSEASRAIEEKVTHAQNDVGQRWTDLPSTTTQDWERYHRLLAAQKKWQADYEGLQSGKVANAKLGKTHPLELLHGVRGRIEAAFHSLEATLELCTQKAMASLPDTVVEKVVDAGHNAQDASVDSEAAGLAASAASMAAVARESASSILAAPAKAVLMASATSVVEQAQTAPTNVVDRAVSAADGAAASVKSYFGDASQAALHAVGIDPSPTDLSQTATYVTKQAKKSATSIASVVADTVVNELPSSASSLAAAATETIVSVAAEATSTVASVASNVASAASEATQAVSEGIALAASAVSSFVAPATATPIVEQITNSIASAASQASSVVHDATRTTAEGVSEVASVASVVKSAVLEHVEL